MASIENIKGSDGSGNASVATVQNTRSPGASTIVVDTVLNINTGGFMGSMGTPHTFTDPITSETITVISEATCVDFSGHVDGSNLEIDDIAPGYSDLGSQVGDIIIIRPTTQWSDEVASVLEVSHEDDGTLKDDTVDTDQLVDSAVETDKINNGAVTPNKLADETLDGSVTTSQTTTSNSFTDLATVGPSVSVDVGINGKALVSIFSSLQVSASASGNSAYVGFAISGATTVAASIPRALRWQPAVANGLTQFGATFLVTGLTPGVNTFTLKYAVDGDTATFANRKIAVMPL